MAEILTPECILSFQSLLVAKPRGIGGAGDPVYSAVLIFPKKVQSSEAFKNLVGACDGIVADKWPKVPKAAVKMPFRDCAEKAGQYAGYDGVGDLFVNVWSKIRPEIIDRDCNPVIMPNDIYSGQTVRCFLSAYGWENSGRKGVSLALGNVQILRNTPRLDGKAPAASAFGKWNDPEDEAA